MADYLAEIRPDIPSLREVVFFTGWAEFLDTAPDQAALPEVRAGDIAQIQYTSAAGELQREPGHDAVTATP